MAETARRVDDETRSDAVRRLIARPIRVHAARVADPTRPTAILREPALDIPAVVEVPSTVSSVPAPASLGRLKAEMTVMKAVLAAERRETQTLRATIGLDEAEETLGEEALAVRNRWAALVDRILHATT